MLNKMERLEKLNNAGINTTKYFSVDLDNGTKIHLIIDENGNVVQTKKDEPTEDVILNQIITDGYVKNTKLHRRFVMAQMFYMLNYTSWDGRDNGYNACLRRTYGYDYTLTMMTEEIRVLSKLETRDRESFEERVHFFDKNVVVAVLEDYIEKVKAYIETLPTKKCKGVPYKKIKGVNIFVADFDKRLYAPIRGHINRIKFARNYAEIYDVLEKFMRNRFRLHWQTDKSKVWIDAYKGNGAYYTLKNLIMYHNCTLTSDKGINYGKDSMAYLKTRLDAYEGEGWRMFALMKKVIADNHYDFYAEMKAKYNK